MAAADVAAGRAAAVVEEAVLDAGAGAAEGWLLLPPPLLHANNANDATSVVADRARVLGFIPEEIERSEPSERPMSA